MNRPAHPHWYPSPIGDHADRSALLDHRSQRAAEYRAKLDNLEHGEKHSRFLVLMLAIVVPLLAWALADTRDQLTDAREALAQVSEKLTKSTARETEWTCRDVKAFKGNVRTCIRTVSRI